MMIRIKCITTHNIFYIMWKTKSMSNCVCVRYCSIKMMSLNITNYLLTKVIQERNYMIQLQMGECWRLVKLLEWKLCVQATVAAQITTTPIILGTTAFLTWNVLLHLFLFLSNLSLDCKFGKMNMWQFYSLHKIFVQDWDNWRNM